MKRTCGNCRFYESSACHRFPPRGGRMMVSMRPEQWCGEHRLAWRTVWESVRAFPRRAAFWVVTW